MVFLMAVYENLIDEQTQNTEELIKEIALGSQDAFKVFYESTKTAVYSFALSFLKNTHDAEDVMQTVYVNVYHSAAQYTAQGKPMAWVLTITKNLCYEKLRSASRFGQIVGDAENDISLSNDMNIDDRLFAEFCLNSLKADERKIVVLHAISGLKHREIARLLDLPLGTVLSKYNRAIGKIKNHLQGGEYGDQ